MLSFSIVKHRWEIEYKPHEDEMNLPGSSKETEMDIFEMEMSKRRRLEPRDELQVYLRDKPVDSTLIKEIGALGWWKVCHCFGLI